MPYALLNTLAFPSVFGLGSSFIRAPIFPSYVYNLKESNTSVGRTVYQDQNENLKLVLTGDSKLNGQVFNGGNEQGTRNPTSRTAAKLNFVGIDSGANSGLGDHNAYNNARTVDGLIAADKRFSKVGSTALAPIETLGGVGFRYNDGTSKLNFRPEGQVTKAVIITPQNPGHARASYSIDGGTEVELNSNGSPAGLLQTVTATLPKDFHTFQIGRASSVSSGSAFSTGVYAYDDTRFEVSCLNMAISGTQSSGLLTETAGQPYTRRPAFKTFAPHITFSNFGLTNDALKVGSPIEPAQSKQNARAHIQDAKISGDVVIVVDSYFSPTITDANASRWEEYRTLCYELADEEDCPLIDFGMKFGSYAESNAAGNMSDNIHESFLGYDRKADTIAAVAKYICIGQYSENFAF